MSAVEFPLARRRLRRRAALRLALGLALTALGIVDLIGIGLAGEGEASPLRIWMLALAGGAWFGAQGILRLAASKRAAIRLGADSVWFPPGIAALRGNEVDYADIELLMAQSRAGRGRVVVGTRARVLIVDALDIGGMMTLKAFHDGLRAHIAASSAGSSHLERVDRGLALTRRLMVRRARCTEVILVVLIAAYVAQIATGAVGPFALLEVDPFEMIRMGAIVPPLIVEDGQWFRLVTGTALHGGLIHIYINGMALLALGGLMERLIGGYRLAIIYVFSALAGSLASVFVSGGLLSVGASGAVFGLLGAFGVMQLRHGRRLPPGIAQSRRWWLFILGANAALPIALPMIDVWAHVGGFVGGAVIAGVLLRRDAAIRPDRSAPFAVQAAAMALVGLAAAGLALGVQHTRSTDRWMATDLRAIVADPTLDPQHLNLLAWTIVTHPDAPHHVLEIALEAAEVASARDPDDVPVRDTRATALYRLQRFDEAIAAQRAVVAHDPRAYYATQLLRFVEADRQARRPEPVGPIAGAEAPDVIEPGRLAATGAAIARSGETLTWSSPDPLFSGEDGVPSDISMIAAFRVGGIARGTVTARMRWMGEGSYQSVRVEGQSPPEEGTVVPLWVERAAESGAKETNVWRFWGVEEAVTKLP